MENRRLLQPVIHFANPSPNINVGEASGSRAELANRIGMLLDQFADNKLFAPAIAVVPSECLAITEALATHSLEPLVLVVPQRTGDATAAILASLARPVRLRSSHFALIPAELALNAPDNIAGQILQAYVSARETCKTIIFARRVGEPDESVVFETAKPGHGSNLLSVLTTGRASETERFSIAMEMGQLYRANGPVILSEQTLVEAARQNTTAVISSCSSAMAVAERNDRILFPNAGFLSLVPGQYLIELLAGKPEALLLHPGGELLKSKPGVETIAAEATLTQTATYGDEIGREYSRPWGRERLVSVEDGARIARLILQPGQKAAWQPTSDVLIYWTVIIGSAFVKTGSELKTATAGEGVNIEPGVNYAITNIGAGELVVYEVSMPMPAKKEANPVARYG